MDLQFIKRENIKRWLGLGEYTFERFMHLVIFVGLPFMLLIELLAYPDEENFLWVRLGLALLSLAIYFGSFRFTFIKKDFIYINYIVIYLVMSHFIFLTYINGFPFFHSSVLIALVVVASLFFRSRTQLLIFQTAMFVLVLQASLLSTNKDVNVWMFMLLYMFMNICSYFIQDHIFRQRDRLELAARNLKRSNKSLEQFAYVASHDLQEPLRTISSYVQLLERRYKGQLDSEADDFIHFTVDAAKRMQALIQGLLGFSRAATSDNMQLNRLDLNEILQHVIENLEARIRENKAQINYPKLPVVQGDRIMIGQLLQNLLSNALKYRSESDPVINIDVKSVDHAYEFSIKDNGIGIAPTYQDDVFTIFKRINSKGPANGTGIGLAVCKRIVLNHGGELWLESEEGKGSTFYFTLNS